jgi:ABC-type lipoprotein export system ATPase subunit
MSEPLLSARAVTKTYSMGKRSLEVLRGVNLDVAGGDFLALRGASGAGKSTLLHLLGALDLPNSGEIRLAGENMTRLPEAALIRIRNQKVGFIFQAYHLLPELDALENVCLPARLARVPARERMDHKPFELSGGEQQRVAIARALINQPDLILADEPTGNLDSHSGDGIMELLCSLRAENQTTLIIATHDATVAARAPKVVELVDGQINT